MPEQEQLKGNVLGSEVPRSQLYQMREMIVGAGWEAFKVVMDNYMRLRCGDILGKADPTDEQLQALSGEWKLLQEATCHFPAEVASAIEDVIEQEAERAAK